MDGEDSRNASVEAVQMSDREDMPLRWQEVTHSTDAAECRQIRSHMNAEYEGFQPPSSPQAHTESPCLLKGRRRVRVGAVGKVPHRGNSLAAYHVFWGRAVILAFCLRLSVVVV